MVVPRFSVYFMVIIQCDIETLCCGILFPITAMALVIVNNSIEK